MCKKQPESVMFILSKGEGSVNTHVHAFRFFASFRMTKLSFVIGEFISGWSHEAWMKIMPCGSL